MINYFSSSHLFYLYSLPVPPSRHLLGTYHQQQTREENAQNSVTILKRIYKYSFATLMYNCKSNDVVNTCSA